MATYTLTDETGSPVESFAQLRPAAAAARVLTSEKGGAVLLGPDGFLPRHYTREYATRSQRWPYRCRCPACGEFRLHPDSRTRTCRTCWEVEPAQVEQCRALGRSGAGARRKPAARRRR